MHDQAINLDAVFGPVNPATEDLAMILKGYESCNPEVVDVLKSLSDEDRAIVLEFAGTDNARPMFLVEYAANLLNEYHRLDPDRHHVGPHEIINTELAKVERFIELYGTMPKFPFIEFDTPFEGGERTGYWGINYFQEGRAQTSNLHLPFLRLIRQCVSNPENIEQALEPWLSTE